MDGTGPAGRWGQPMEWRRSPGRLRRPAAPPGAPRLHSTACPQRPRKTREVSWKGEAPSSVSRRPLDYRARVRRRRANLSSGNPHRPQVRLLLHRYIPFFSAFGRMGSNWRATLAPSPERFVRSPRRALITPAPTRQNSCRGRRHNNCRCTLTSDVATTGPTSVGSTVSTYTPGQPGISVVGDALQEAFAADFQVCPPAAKAADTLGGPSAPGRWHPERGISRARGAGLLAQGED